MADGVEAATSTETWKGGAQSALIRIRQQADTVPACLFGPEHCSVRYGLGIDGATGVDRTAYRDGVIAKEITRRAQGVLYEPHLFLRRRFNKRGAAPFVAFKTLCHPGNATMAVDEQQQHIIFELHTSSARGAIRRISSMHGSCANGG